MFDELNFTAYGYFDDGLNSQNTWQGTYDPALDTRGRGYPDWLPENTTTIPPNSPTDVFDKETQQWVAA